MTSEPRAEITTILFTDLVSSTDLVQRVGDDAAQRIFEAHHGLLGDLVWPATAARSSSGSATG